MRRLGSEMKDYRRNLGGQRFKRRARVMIPAGDLRETVRFFLTTTRIGGAQATKDLTFLFSAKAQVREATGGERIFRHINVKNKEVSHVMTLAFRPELKDEYLVRWYDDLFTIVASTTIQGQAVKYHQLGCRLNGDVLLEAAKA